MIYDALAVNALTLRDYFAAHAPTDPWPHFRPVVQSGPVRPSIRAIDNNGNIVTDDEERRRLEAWLDDSCWDIWEETGYEKFSQWCHSWIEYHKAHGEWERRKVIERAQQWPWFYADAMLSGREL